MSSNQSKNKRSNKRRLRRGPDKKRLVIYLVLVGIVIAFFQFDKSPQEDRQGLENASDERLKSLPYLSWTPTNNASESGVTKFDPEKSLSGVNLYKSGDTPEAFLMGMQGSVLHRWAATIEQDDTWSNIELTKNGELLVFLNYEKLIRLDWNSNITWQSENLGFHHDLSVSKENEIYALARKVEYVPELSITHRIANDYITILNDAGEVQQSLSIAELILDANIPIIRADIEADYPRDTPLRRIIARIENNKNTNRTAYSLFAPTLRKLEQYYEKLVRPKDFLHTNTIDIVHNDTPHNAQELFGPGTVLICVRNQNLIAVVDIEQEKIVWSWGPEELEHPHDPVLLDNGNLLIFDNGYKRKYSRILELNPVTREIVWEYKSQPTEDFYSETRGSNQKLGNGNILIADSRNGRAFEITHDGEIVWEFYNPEIRIENDDQMRATIFRMRRIADSDFQLLTPNNSPPAAQ